MDNSGIDRMQSSYAWRVDHHNIALRHADTHTSTSDEHRRERHAYIHLRGDKDTPVIRQKVLLYFTASNLTASLCRYKASDSRLKRSRVRIPAVPLTGNNFGQVVHTMQSLGIGQATAVMPCGSEGNRRSVVYPYELAA